MYIKPRDAALIVRDPLTAEPLPATGQAKPDNSYWQRRLREGDVIKATPPRSQTKPKGGKHAH